MSDLEEYLNSVECLFSRICDCRAVSAYDNDGTGLLEVVETIEKWALEGMSEMRKLRSELDMEVDVIAARKKEQNTRYYCRTGAGYRQVVLPVVGEYRGQT